MEQNNPLIENGIYNNYSIYRFIRSQRTTTSQAVVGSKPLLVGHDASERMTLYIQYTENQWINTMGVAS